MKAGRITKKKKKPTFLMQFLLSSYFLLGEDPESRSVVPLWKGITDAVHTYVNLLVPFSNLVVPMRHLQSLLKHTAVLPPN